MDQNVSPVNQPALDTANHVLQTILAQPFIWPWNRVSASLPILVNTQDTAIALTDFGFLELASTDGTADASVGEMTVDPALASSALTGNNAVKGRPAKISLLLDDNAGNYTFRTRPVADGAYTGKIIYQKKPVLFTSLGGLWSPIPDEMGYIYDEGFLALTLAYEGDPLFQFFSQRFVAHLLGRAQGLTEMQKNIFLTDWMVATRQMQAAALNTQAGRSTI
jgi:hypothetical protein